MTHEKSDLKRQQSFARPSVNPFVHPCKTSRAQKLQILLMSVFVVPFRAIALAFFFLLTWTSCYVFTLGMPPTRNRPASRFRAALFDILRVLGRITFFCIGFHHVEVRGKRASSAEAPVLVMAPHSSFFDGIAVFVGRGLPSAVSRSENAEAPLLGTLLKAVQPINVSRDDPDSRQNTINTIRERASSKGLWPQLVIFPEGCCTNGQALITFKSGAFIPAVPVQPVLIEYLNDWDTYRWTMKGIDGLIVLWYTMCQLQTRCRVTFLPVHVPSELEAASPKLFAQRVRSEMAEVLRVPCTEHSFEDCRLMRHSTKLDLPMEAGLIEFSKISRKLDMDIEVGFWGFGSRFSGFWELSRIWEIRESFSAPSESSQITRFVSVFLA